MGPTVTLTRTRLLPLGVFLASGLIALVCWALAYQTPLQHTLHVGGDVDRQRREDDRPFFNGSAHGSEPATPNDVRWWEAVSAAGPFRWTRPDTTAIFPGVGGGGWIVTVRATPGGRSDATDLRSQWTLGRNQPLEVPLIPGDPRRYHILTATPPSGDLTLHFQTPPYTPPGDPRELGFVLHEIRIQSIDQGWRTPAWSQLALLAISLALIATLTRWLAWGWRGTLIVIIASTLLSAGLLSSTRTALTFFTPILAGLALSCTAMGVVGWWLISRQLSADTALRQFMLHILALSLLAFAVRMGGMLHPHAIYSDSGFNANNLLRVSMGQVFLEAGLPSEAGGGVAPYPPGFYLLSLPAQLLIPPVHSVRVILVQATTALLDSLMIPLIAIILIRANLGRPAALFGAALYLLPITALESFAVGELANISGQALAMPFIALLAIGVGAAQANEQRSWRLSLLIGSLAMGLVAHSGVTLSLGAFTAAAWGMAIVGQIRRQQLAITVQRLTLVASIALGSIVLIYYSAYLPGLLARSSAETADTARSLALGQLLQETALGLLGIVPPRFRAWSLPAGLCLAALGGLGWLWRHQSRLPEAGALRNVLVAWWLGMALTQALLLIADQGVRWSLFLYPALCLSAGALLGAWWAQGHWRRGMSIGVLTWVMGYGIWMWVSHVRDYFHI
jgi:hypothetical protein